MNIEDTPSRSAEAAGFAPDSIPEQDNRTGAWQAKTRKWIPNPADNRRHRTLVICFDGTGERFDQKNSNVIKFVSLLKKDEASKQMVYYLTGIGTESEADARFSLIRKGSQVLDLMFATTLGLHIREGYEFLCQNYQRGDVVCIFGFSRGAYTARALAGMIQKVGVLPPWNTQMIPFAYQMYSSTNNMDLAKDFKATFSVDVKIEFVGVWDTVASVGLIPRYLPFVSSNSSIRYFRHAVALDEHRVKFAPSYYRRSHGPEDKNKTDDWAFQKGINDKDNADNLNGSTNDDDNTHDSAHPDKLSKKIHKSQKTDSLEVWFAGAHTDVGGGSVPNRTRHSLARIPLRWMIRECFNCKTGIIFDGQMLRDLVGMDVNLEHQPWSIKPAPHDRLEPDPNNPEHRFPAPSKYLEGVPLVSNVPLNAVINLPLTIFRGVASKVLPSRVSSILDVVLPPSSINKRPTEWEPFKGEAVEELFDALSPSYDQLEIAPFWWLLEFIPLQIKKELKAYVSNEPSILDYAWIQNRGEGRKIFKHVVMRGLQVHRSVLTRLEALDHRGNEGTYQPRVRPNFVEKVDEGYGEVERGIQYRRMTNDEWKSQTTDELNDISHKWAY